MAAADGVEETFRTNLEVSLDVAAYDDEAVGYATVDGIQTWFMLYPADEGYERAIPLEKGFLYRSPCDDACHAGWTGYTFENISDPTGLGRLPGIESTAENAFAALVALGSAGAGEVLAQTVSRALGIDPASLPKREVALSIDFGAAADAILVGYSYEVEDIAYQADGTDFLVDVAVDFSYALLSGFEFPDLSDYCPSFGNATLPGSRTTALESDRVRLRPRGGGLRAPLRT
ncbi:MAG: hypothetical protein MZU97_11495 [Bacillus subtilis]|nr:hypothetical protein [Bacillus subtilis]